MLSPDYLSIQLDDKQGIANSGLPYLLETYANQRLSSPVRLLYHYQHTEHSPQSPQTFCQPSHWEYFILCDQQDALKEVRLLQ